MILFDAKVGDIQYQDISSRVVWIELAEEKLFSRSESMFDVAFHT